MELSAFVSGAVLDRWPLTGPWNLSWCTDGPAAPRSPGDLEMAGMESVPAQVPGNVELDLERAGRIPDPFYSTNCLELRALEANQWWYRTEFATPAVGPDTGVDLVFAGMDCFATVWLNGRELGHTANAMIEHRFDVTGTMHTDGTPNRLAVRLRSPINAVREEPLVPHDLSMPQARAGLRARKPPHCYGWDIAPRIVSAGLWRPVYLEARPAHSIRDLFVRTLAVHGTHATLGILVDCRTSAPDLRAFRVHVEGVCGDSRFEAEQPLLFPSALLQVTLPNARLWWPRGQGDPNLYTVTARLLEDDREVARFTDRVGIRTLELERDDLTTDDTPGRFRFVVNGRPVFVMGANWVPADAFHSRDIDRIPAILDLFTDLGCNMIRCWGGNVYEPHRFFEICDREGIMVWQDFAMACAMYPLDDAFLDTLRVEAEAVVRELRRHPCLALWCGDNECDMAYQGWHGQRLDPAMNRITRELLPRIVDRLDPGRAYLPSSPYLAPAVVARGGDQRWAPEQHLWGPRDYFRAPYYSENRAAFASEMGYHGCPNLGSIQRFLPPEDVWPWQGNRNWQVHATDPVPGVSHMDYRVQLMADQIGETFGRVPEQPLPFVRASQVVQAEAKKYFIELFRSRKWRTGGLLWWNVMDCWPQFSDAVVDYYFTRKLAYTYIRRAQRPLCLCIGDPEDWSVPLFVCNDLPEPCQGTYTVTDADSDAVVAEGDLDAPANTTQRVARIRVSRGEQRLLLIRWKAGTESGVNHALVGTPPFDLDRYEAWLPLIAALDNGFDPERMGR